MSLPTQSPKISDDLLGIGKGPKPCPESFLFIDDCSFKPKPSPLNKLHLQLEKNGSVTHTSSSTDVAPIVYHQSRISEFSHRFNYLFDTISLLGSGSFSEVYKVRSKADGKLYAVKWTKKHHRGDEDRKNSIIELHSLSRIGHHPNLISFIQAWECDGLMIIQTELCENGNLESFITENDVLDESMLWNILLDVALGTKWLHDQNVIHLDIKPENILLSSEGSFKIGDFGLTHQLGLTTASMEGDSRYLAPEALDSTPTCAADVFSIGATLFEASERIIMPSQGGAWHRLRHNPPMLTGRSKELNDLVHRMLSFNPLDRPSIDEVLFSPTLQKMLNERMLKYPSMMEISTKRMSRIASVFWSTFFKLALHPPLHYVKRIGGKAEQTEKEEGSKMDAEKDQANTFTQRKVEAVQQSEEVPSWIMQIEALREKLRKREEKRKKEEQSNSFKIEEDNIAVSFDSSVKRDDSTFQFPFDEPSPFKPKPQQIDAIVDKSLNEFDDYLNEFNGKNESEKGEDKMEIDSIDPNETPPKENNTTVSLCPSSFSSKETTPVSSRSFIQSSTQNIHESNDSSNNDSNALSENTSQAASEPHTPTTPRAPIFYPREELDFIDDQHAFDDVASFGSNTRTATPTIDLITKNCTGNTRSPSRPASFVTPCAFSPMKPFAQLPTSIPQPSSFASSTASDSFPALGKASVAQNSQSKAASISQNNHPLALSSQAQSTASQNTVNAEELNFTHPLQLATYFIPISAELTNPFSHEINTLTQIVHKFDESQVQNASASDPMENLNQSQQNNFMQRQESSKLQQQESSEQQIQQQTPSPSSPSSAFSSSNSSTLFPEATHVESMVPLDDTQNIQNNRTLPSTSSHSPDITSLHHNSTPSLFATASTTNTNTSTATATASASDSFSSPSLTPSSAPTFYSFLNSSVSPSNVSWHALTLTPSTPSAMAPLMATSSPSASTVVQAAPSAFPLPSISALSSSSSLLSSTALPTSSITSSSFPISSCPTSTSTSLFGPLTTLSATSSYSPPASSAPLSFQSSQQSTVQQNSISISPTNRSGYSTTPFISSALASYHNSAKQSPNFIPLSPSLSSLKQQQSSQSDEKRHSQMGAVGTSNQAPGLSYSPFLSLISASISKPSSSSDQSPSSLSLHSDTNFHRRPSHTRNHSHSRSHTRSTSFTRSHSRTPTKLDQSQTSCSSSVNKKVKKNIEMKFGQFQLQRQTQTDKQRSSQQIQIPTKISSLPVMIPRPLLVSDHSRSSVHNSRSDNEMQADSILSSSSPFLPLLPAASLVSTSPSMHTPTNERSGFYSANSPSSNHKTHNSQTPSKEISPFHSFFNALRDEEDEVYRLPSSRSMNSASPSTPPSTPSTNESHRSASSSHNSLDRQSTQPSKSSQITQRSQHFRSFTPESRTMTPILSDSGSLSTPRQTHTLSTPHVQFFTPPPLQSPTEPPLSPILKTRACLHPLRENEMRIPSEFFGSIEPSKKFEVSKGGNSKETSLQKANSLTENCQISSLNSEPSFPPNNGNAIASTAFPLPGASSSFTSSISTSAQPQQLTTSQLSSVESPSLQGISSSIGANKGISNILSRHIFEHSANGYDPLMSPDIKTIDLTHHILPFRSPSFSSLIKNISNSDLSSSNDEDESEDEDDSSENSDENKMIIDEEYSTSSIQKMEHDDAKRRITKRNKRSRTEKDNKMEQDVDCKRQLMFRSVEEYQSQQIDAFLMEASSASSKTQSHSVQNLSAFPSQFTLTDSAYSTQRVLFLPTETPMRRLAPLSTPFVEARSQLPQHRSPSSRDQQQQLCSAQTPVAPRSIVSSALLASTALSPSSSSLFSQQSSSSSSASLSPSDLLHRDSVVVTPPSNLDSATSSSPSSSGMLSTQLLSPSSSITQCSSSDSSPMFTPTHTPTLDAPRPAISLASPKQFAYRSLALTSIPSVIACYLTLPLGILLPFISSTISSSYLARIVFTNICFSEEQIKVLCNNFPEYYSLLASAGLSTFNSYSSSSSSALENICHNYSRSNQLDSQSIFAPAPSFLSLQGLRTPTVFDSSTIKSTALSASCLATESSHSTACANQPSSHLFSTISSDSSFLSPNDSPSSFSSASTFSSSQFTPHESSDVSCQSHSTSQLDRLRANIAGKLCGIFLVSCFRNDFRGFHQNDSCEVKGQSPKETQKDSENNHLQEKTKKKKRKLARYAKPRRKKKMQRLPLDKATKSFMKIRNSDAFPSPPQMLIDSFLCSSSCNASSPAISVCITPSFLHFIPTNSPFFSSSQAKLQQFNHSCIHFPLFGPFNGNFRDLAYGSGFFPSSECKSSSPSTSSQSHESPLSFPSNSSVHPPAELCTLNRREHLQRGCGAYRYLCSLSILLNSILLFDW
ncbi:putative membrane-associated tyrosine- and threonine-specific cdc2-inhibitory kinase [Monocercomonoides exilis]|uniref:putative membrane-associated tyrosine- and threonine-specific cdc2-inhibitory kinase n=1 Tax=Monocercomonoides exilis TaxID=2049356 RepID=UPI00355A64E3|nr:putative membrane-associated tyrosine- and threonine-specific cdc2-inhibitory kinase [Monocercomonoides exilis]|eukprot:MONOS_1927.1-p1 / transcript=MONOS_1927.1 / gene=MONOS_1927 / organism=Monocercomonoides_exilis_PA203 / gene_product=serine / transcript_product=serine / location=Mono_scaffold00037:16186-23301(+) / protein_length=2371 / sequence_SO=supercontig / SO=protein_coding / is_pseudo=false